MIKLSSMYRDAVVIGFTQRKHTLMRIAILETLIRVDIDYTDNITSVDQKILGRLLKRQYYDTWCTDSAFLTYFENCPNSMQVDHVVAIGDGGLHCLKNLQYLTASEHGTKSCHERYARRR